MTFLELCQEVRSDLGISGTGPTTTVSQTGMNKHIVDWVQQANLHLQGLYHDWQFMLGEASLSITEVSASNVVTNETDFHHIDKTSLLLTDGTTKSEPDLVPYRDLRDSLKLTIPTNRATSLAIKPDKNILLSALPDTDYTLTFDYYKKPLLMDGNTDTSLIPVAHERLIILKAKMYFAEFRDATTVMNFVVSEYTELLEIMKSDQLPDADVALYGQNEEITVVPQ